MEALSVTGRYRVMRAEVSFMLFGFGRSGKGSRKEKPSGGFRGSLNDEVHGAHSDGENIILSAAAGGGSYPAKEAGQWVSDETLSGQYRLVFQPMNLKGQRTGGLLVSTNIVSRQVVLRVCGLRGVTGMLSAYTPDREDAVALMREANGEDPVEYRFLVGVFSDDFYNMRRLQRPDGDGLPCPMCLFGEYLGDEESINLPENSQRLADFTLGAHLEGDGIRLSTDLGGILFKESDVRPADVPEGSLRLLIDSDPAARMAGREPADGPHISLSSEDIPRDIAVRILMDRFRPGLLNVYTPRREDAMELMREALGGKRPYEEKFPEGLDGMSCFRRSSGEGPRAVYGLETGEGPGD